MGRGGDVGSREETEEGVVMQGVFFRGVDNCGEM